MSRLAHACSRSCRAVALVGHWDRYPLVIAIGRLKSINRACRRDRARWSPALTHLLLSPEAANRFSSASIEKHVRAWEKPSDHVPVAIDLALLPA